MGIVPAFFPNRRGAHGKLVMSEVLVEVDGLWKKYCRDLRTSLSYGLRDLANECTGQPVGDELRPKEFWALQDISIELKRGQCLGLIGGNGAGKSTLLKIISGLVKPTRGTVCVQGTIQALIELGAGFHPALSGRENILINAAVLGIPHEDIKKKLDEIIEFAELQDFIDAPIQSYSSGMRVRLGFAVAIQMSPDILLIDEVLAVGDPAFRIKAREEINRIIGKNKAVVVVSHNMNHIVQLCDEAVLLNKGVTISKGPPAILAHQFMTGVDSTVGSGEIAPLWGKERQSNSLELACVSVNGGERRHVAIKINENPIFDISLSIRGNGEFDLCGWHILFLEDAQGVRVGFGVVEDRINGSAKVLRQLRVEMGNLHSGKYIVHHSFESAGTTIFSCRSLFSMEIEPTHMDATQVRVAQAVDNGRGTHRIVCNLK